MKIVTPVKQQENVTDIQEKDQLIEVDKEQTMTTELAGRDFMMVTKISTKIKHELTEAET